MTVVVPQWSGSYRECLMQFNSFISYLKSQRTWVALDQQDVSPDEHNKVADNPVSTRKQQCSDDFSFLDHLDFDKSGYYDFVDSCCCDREPLYLFDSHFFSPDSGLPLHLIQKLNQMLCTALPPQLGQLLPAFTCTQLESNTYGSTSLNHLIDPAQPSNHAV